MTSSPAWENQGALDIPLAGILVANMIQDYLRGNKKEIFGQEEGHDIKDPTPSSGEESLCLSAAIDDWASAPPPGEHRAPICPEGQSTATWLARRDDSSSGWGF